jgi:quercetin dioxygenase-like cupin family protein
VSEAAFSATSRMTRPGDLIWIEQSPGSRYAFLDMSSAGGVITLTRFDAGAVGGWHTHPGGEHLYMVSGHIRLDGHDLHGADFLSTPPGIRHRVEAVEDSELLVILPQLPVYD